jgi:hypothetical protein
MGWAFFGVTNSRFEHSSPMLYPSQISVSENVPFSASSHQSGEKKVRKQEKSFDIHISLFLEELVVVITLFKLTFV